MGILLIGEPEGGGGEGSWEGEVGTVYLHQRQLSGNTLQLNVIYRPVAKKSLVMFVYLAFLQNRIVYFTSKQLAFLK